MNEFVSELDGWQLVALCSAILGGLIALSTAIGFALEAGLGDRRKIFDLPRAPGQLRWELFGTLRFWLMGSIAFAWLLHVAPLAEQSAFSIGTTFIVCWLGFEVYYWGLHRIMHLRRFYRFHRYHHDSRVTSPLTGYSMSTLESLGWLVGLIGVPLAWSFVTPISLIGLLAYHALYQVAGNVIGHANVDFLPAALGTRANSWISHPTTYHALHHARFNNHYSFGSSFMDRLIGTEWADWFELRARVIEGRPMTKLSERGSAASPS